MKPFPFATSEEDSIQEKWKRVLTEVYTIVEDG